MHTFAHTGKNPHQNPWFAPKIKLPIRVRTPQTKFLGPPLLTLIFIYYNLLLGGTSGILLEVIQTHAHSHPYHQSNPFTLTNHPKKKKKKKNSWIEPIGKMLLKLLQFDNLESGFGWPNRHDFYFPTKSYPQWNLLVALFPTPWAMEEVEIMRGPFWQRILHTQTHACSIE